MSVIGFGYSTSKVEISGSWGDDYTGHLYWRSKSDRSLTDYPWKNWVEILDTNNYSSYAASANHTHSYLPLSGGTMTGAIKYGGGSYEIIRTGGDDTSWRGGLKYSWSSNTTIALWGKHINSQFVWHAGTDFSSNDVNGTTTRSYDFQVGRSNGTLEALIGGNKIWHAGNSNLITVPWSASSLTLVGAITGATDINMAATGEILWSYTNSSSTEGALIWRSGYAYSDHSYGDLNFRAGSWTSDHNLIAFRFSTNFDQYALCIQNSGNVGIGTTSPSYKLHVNGSANATTLYENGNRVITSDNISSQSVSYATSAGKAHDLSGVNANDQLNMTGSSWDGFAFNYYSGKYDGDTLQPQSIRIYDGKYSEIARFTTSGFFGLGTGSPSFRLHVIGDTYTSGYSRSGNGFIKGNSSDSYVLLGGGGHKSISDFALSSHTHSYLPLTGGALAAPNDCLLQINNTNTAAQGSYINFFVNGTAKGQVGWYEGYGAYIYTHGSGHSIKLLDDGTAKIDSNAILHAGNYTNYTVTKTGSGANGTWGIDISGNASTATTSGCSDYVKVFSSSGWNDVKSTTTPRRVYFYDSYNDGGPDTYGNVIDIVGIHGHWEPQLFFGGWTGGHVYFRNKDYNGNSFGSWKTLIDSELIGSQSVNYANSAGSVAWSNVTGKPDTFTPSSHTHTNIVSLGNKNASDLSSTYPSGLSTSGIYGNGYPFSYGCCMTSMANGGAFQIAGQWNADVTGASNYDFPTEMYIRGRRDSYDVWTTWTRVVTNRNWSSIISISTLSNSEIDSIIV